MHSENIKFWGVAWLYQCSLRVLIILVYKSSSICLIFSLIFITFGYFLQPLTAYIIYCNIIHTLNRIKDVNFLDKCSIMYILQLHVCLPAPDQRHLYISYGGLLLLPACKITYVIVQDIVILTCDLFISTFNKTFFVCLEFFVPLENSLLIWRRHRCRLRLQIWTHDRHLWPISSEGSSAYHTYCDTGHAFVMVISEDLDIHT